MIWDVVFRWAIYHILPAVLLPNINKERKMNTSRKNYLTYYHEMDKK